MMCVQQQQHARWRCLLGDVCMHARCTHHLPQVCHIDSGVRTDHPDLEGRILAGWNLVPEVQVRGWVVACCRRWRPPIGLLSTAAMLSHAATARIVVK